MPTKKSARKPKRNPARSAGKDGGKHKIDRLALLQTHAAVNLALAQSAAPAPAEAPQPVAVNLLQTPQDLMRDLERTFCLEFPRHAHRARFALEPGT